MRIALDFDGTVVERHSYPKIGKDLGAIPTLLRIQELGARIFLWTCRGGRELAEAEQYLEQRGIDLHPMEFLQGSAKPLADLYIDDRGLGAPLMPEGLDWPAVGPTLIKAMELLARVEPAVPRTQEADPQQSQQGDGES